MERLCNVEGQFITSEIKNDEIEATKTSAEAESREDTIPFHSGDTKDSRITEDFEKFQKEEDITLFESVEETKLKYLSFLAQLNLNPDVKLTLNDARTVDNHTFLNENLTSTNQIPGYIVDKLMIVDYHARAFKLNYVSIEQEANSDESSDGSSDESDNEESNSRSPLKGTVNPMDAFLAVFHGADDFLRHDLAIKTSSCQLSVPFLLPDPVQPSEKITMLLWALEGIKKSWKSSSDNHETIRARHVFALEHPFPIVSFIRVGSIKFSKSYLINQVMTDDNGHNYFFHKDCKGGGVERRIVDGLVELCWYLPGERKFRAFQEEICFANLRGDVRKFKKQLKVLMKISSVIFLLLPSEYPQQSTKEILIETTKAKAKLVLIFYAKPQEAAKQYFDNLKRQHRGKLSSIQRVTQANEGDFVEVIRRKIQKNTSIVKSPLGNLASFARECDIDLEKNYDVNSTWRELIAQWLQLGPKEAKLGLKLQTLIPALANLKRENFNPKRQGSKTDKERIDESYAKIKAANNSQKQLFSKMDERIRNILNHIASLCGVGQHDALSMLKHDLDKMSLEVLGSLQTKYRDAWLKVQKEKRERRQILDSSEPHLTSPEELNLKRLEDSIKESSFGLEHIIREIAQMFQLTEISHVYNYTGVATNILLSGQPLELMDGDSSYIPVKWFNAVFSELQRKTENAKVFVISVLGIQSSGKSTMLNTMFGLEFPVSAGRCTRGAFASLIPVSDSLKSVSNFDYVLIIDTEGLRGSGDLEVREHDNELATFAIGVADLTIVNIMGENYNEMKEFLEIAVHAFLKMELVNEKRMCQIVHQNVAAIEASDVLAIERITLKKKLDEMAKLAAIQEKCEDRFQELNDILSFDENEDVFYIPNLLQGSPPMAPVNPDYGRAVQRVKEKIVSLMCLPERSPHLISQFQKRICDLWKAILRENFIFSFRNTIEVRAYTSLDKKFFEESVKTMVTGMAELERQVQVSLMRSSAENREDIWSVSRMQISEKAEELGQKMESAMENFFETNEDKATLEQWRETVMIKIQNTKDSQRMEVERNCKAAFYHWQNRQEVDIKKKIYEQVLLEKAKIFMTSVEDTNDVEKCTAKFGQEWTQWINDVPPCDERQIDVNQEMLIVLCHTDHKLGLKMNEKCKAQNFQIVTFEESYPSIQGRLKVAKWESLKGEFRYNSELYMDAEKIKDQAIAATYNFARSTSKEGIRCRPDDLTRMYHLVVKTIQDDTAKQPFKFPDSLLCDILLFSFANTYDTFCEMEERYIRERDIRGDLERNLRPKLEKYFVNTCKEMEKEVLAATLFVDVLKYAIESELNKSMGPAVAGEILKKDEFQSKGQFHVSELIKLGEQGKFKLYTKYLINPVEFLKKKLIKSIEDFCLTTDNPINSILESEVKRIKDKVLSAISDATRLTKKVKGTFSIWILRFVESCSTLEITTEMFAVAAIDDELKDFEMFESQVLQYVTEFLKLLVDLGVNRNVYATWNPAPHEKLLDLMFGCQEYCPFCKGLCDQTVRNHSGGHSTRIHRPQGIASYVNTETSVLLSHICTTLVASNGTFQNNHTCNIRLPYKDYQTVNDYYKSWSIPPDPSLEASAYWKWFMATFSQELANHCNAEQPNIPSAWKSITFDDVSKQLREEYNLA